MDARRRGAGDAAAARARDAAQAQALAEALDAAADVPEEDRFARVVEGDGELAELLKGDNAARLDVCAAYLRRVHLHPVLRGARCRDEVDLLTRDAAWLTRPDAADEPLNAAEELALFEKESTKLRDRLSETRKRRRPDGDEAADEAKDEEPKDEEKEEEEDWGASLRAEDEKTIRLIQQATREADATAEPDAPAGVGPGPLLPPARPLREAVPARGPVPRGRARAFARGLHKLEEDNGRARCAFEWCRKLFKSDEYLKKHLANRHGDHLEAYLTSARRPFMWAVYDADAHKPLPPLRTANGDEVEPLDLLRGGDFQAPRKRDRRDRDRGRDRDRRDRGRRDDFRSPRRYAAGPPRPPPGAERSSDTRKPPSYDDVDALPSGRSSTSTTAS